MQTTDYRIDLGHPNAQVEANEIRRERKVALIMSKHEQNSENVISWRKRLFWPQKFF